MNRYGTPVLFTLEKNVYTIAAHISFGANGAPTLLQPHSKGFCNISQGSIAFTGATSNGSPTISSPSSFAGLYKGMVVKDSGPTNVNSTISSMSVGGPSITLADNATGTNTGLTASGGIYTLQFGTQAGQRLDTYVTILGFMYHWYETGSAQGNDSTLALAPAAPEIFITTNNIGVRTIPATATSPNTDATLTFQMGSGAGTSFSASNPASGENLCMTFVLGTSTAM